ncbi:MAG: ribonuclease Z [Candidatus Marinimicrobia bacterium]|nr:ribonuclease Z [Candidatus Neomarinimicrobiota bacterium]
MKLTILGSGTHIPVKHRSNPAYILDINGKTILIDCGSGALRQLVKANRTIWEIDKIFLSHLHIDHTIDLVPLFFTFKYQKNITTEYKLISIYAHDNFSIRLNDLEQIYGKWMDSEYRGYQHNPISPNSFKQDDFRIETFSAAHSEESLIFRFIDHKNQKFVYSGDTSLTENLVKAAYRADLLLIECSGLENQEISGHLKPQDVKSVISAAKPKKTIITHIHPLLDNEDLIWKVTPSDCDVALAADLQVYRVG